MSMYQHNLHLDVPQKPGDRDIIILIYINDRAINITSSASLLTITLDLTFFLSVKWSIIQTYIKLY